MDEDACDEWSGSTSPVTPVPLSPLATTSIGSGAADYLLFRRVPSPSSAVSLASSTDTLVDDEKEGDGWIDTAGAQHQHKHYEASPGPKWSIGSGEPRKREASPAYRQGRAGREVRGRLFGAGAVPAALLAFAVAFVALSVAAFLLPAAGAEYPCQRPYQAQAYMDFPAFNTSRLSGKYALHLFRDPDPADGLRAHRDATPGFQPTGVPAVFVPGNAGSFRQVRHLAAETMRQFAAASASESPSSGGDGLKAPIDMYTLDFGEDLTAFHGQALLDQAEYLNDAIAYILTLYSNQGPAGGPRPRSVMLLGHSMGGVVARTVFLMPNFVPGSVETIVTFAAPHTAPPATFDADIVRAYDSVNGFWRRAFSRDSAGRNPLAHVSLISIAGGHLDHMIPSNHAGVSSLVPPSNGFAVLTNSVPGVWSGIGHEEILWCDPLRRAVAAALVSVVDARSPAKVLPLDDRMRVFRQRLLTGLEETAATDKTVDRQVPPPPAHHRAHTSSSSSRSAPANSRSRALPPDTRLTYGETSALTVAANEKFDILNVSRPTQGPATFLMPISDKTQLPSAALSLLSEAPLLEGDFKGNDGFYVLACRFPSGAGSTGALSQVDLSANGGRPRVSLLCHNLAPYAVQLPREALPSAQPAPIHTHAFAGTPQQQGLDGIATAKTTTTTAMTNDNYWYLGLNATKYLEGYSYLAVVDTTHHRDQQHSLRRLVAQVLPDESAAHVSVGSKNAWKMWFGKGKRVVLPVDRPVKVDVSFPSVWSSLLAYRLRVVPSKLATGLETGTGVIPVLCQSIEDPHESKFYLRAAPGSLMPVDIHGVAPFTPYSLRYADDADSAAYHGLRIQVWSDRAHDAPIDLVLELDVVRSLGKLVLHYRTALAVLPMFVVMLVVMLQLWGYGASGVFPSFGDTLVLLSTRYLVVLLAGIAVVPYIASVPLVDRLLYVIEPWMDLDDGCGGAGTGTGRLVRRVGFFLGLEPSHLVWLGPLFMLVSLGMAQLTYYLVLLVVQPLAFAVGSIAPYRPKTARSMTARRRRIAILIVGLIVASYVIPYQPAFALLFIVQAVACVRALWVLQSLDTALCDAHLDVARLPDVDVERSQPLVPTSAKPTPRIVTTTNTANKTNLRMLAALTARARNHYRYAVSLMVIFVWLLPINLPYMAVWVHNLRVSWAMTFSAQHSFLSIAPMFAVAEMCLSGKTLPRTHPAVSSRALLTMGMLGYMAAYCLLFGIQRAYWLHHLVNLFCAWLLVLYCEADASLLCKGLGLSRFFDVYAKS